MLISFYLFCVFCVADIFVCPGSLIYYTINFMSTLDTNIPLEKLIRILNKHIDLSFKVAGARGEREFIMVDIYSAQLCKSK